MKKIIALIFSLILILSVTSCGNQSNSTDIHNLYKVERTDNFLFSYTITDRKGNVLVSDTTNRQPEITVINDHILSKYIQYGTGITTRETIYYNVDTGDISENGIATISYLKGNNHIETNIEFNLN